MCRLDAGRGYTDLADARLGKGLHQNLVQYEWSSATNDWGVEKTEQRLLM